MLPLLDPGLDPLFWPNLRANTPSAWHGHVPFAHWLVTAWRPRVLVELGTHAGVSYAAFCQAVQRGDLGTQCSAVDTWAGDDHAGAYGDEVHAELKAFHDPRFGSFSRLLRTTFDAAAESFADGTVDLLHIDGFHTYEAVRHDFETWRPKLSERAVVLFHDIHVRVRDFGVWRFWEEIRASGTASLEFLHAFGLGVLLTGPLAAPALRELCAAPVERVRGIFATLGERHVLEYDRSHAPAVVPVAQAVAAPPPVDASLDPGTVHIAERFAAPAGLQAVRLPRDATSRGARGCTVWVVSADGQEWRQGDVEDVSGETVTLGFAPFRHDTVQHFHLFVTDPCAVGSGLPPALIRLLAQRRAPVALDTPALATPVAEADPHRLVVLAERGA